MATNRCGCCKDGILFMLPSNLCSAGLRRSIPLFIVLFMLLGVVLAGAQELTLADRLQILAHPAAEGMEAAEHSDVGVMQISQRRSGFLPSVEMTGCLNDPLSCLTPS